MGNISHIRIDLNQLDRQTDTLVYVEQAKIELPQYRSEAEHPLDSLDRLLSLSDSRFFVSKITEIKA